MLRVAAGILILLLAACSSLVPPAAPTLSPLEIQGEAVFDSYCSRCHSTNVDTVVVGPSLAGIATRSGKRMKDMDSEMYIRNSILNPNGYTVEGYPEGTMPSTLKDELAEEELEAVIVYLLTLK
jgi:mono/diheme cytochrome c family protein